MTLIVLGLVALLQLRTLWVLRRQTRLMSELTDKLDALDAKFQKFVADVKAALANATDLSAAIAEVDKIAGEIDTADAEIGAGG